MLSKNSIKIIVAGEGAVGKTTFLTRLINDKFDPDLKMTKGLEIFCKNVNNCDLSIWDFAGQDQFRFMLDGFVKGAKGAFVMFDVTRLNTLEKIDEWMKMLKKSGNGNIPVVLLGAKDDLLDPKTEESLKEFILEIKKNYDNCVDYMNISAKTGHNIQDAFDVLVSKIFENNP